MTSTPSSGRVTIVTSPHLLRKRGHRPPKRKPTHEESDQGADEPHATASDGPKTAFARRRAERKNEVTDIHASIRGGIAGRARALEVSGVLEDVDPPVVVDAVDDPVGDPERVSGVRPVCEEPALGCYLSVTLDLQQLDPVGACGNHR